VGAMERKVAAACEAGGGAQPPARAVGSAQGLVDSAPSCVLHLHATVSPCSSPTRCCLLVPPHACSGSGHRKQRDSAERFRRDSLSHITPTPTPPMSSLRWQLVSTLRWQLVSTLRWQLVSTLKWQLVSTLKWQLVSTPHTVACQRARAGHGYAGAGGSIPFPPRAPRRKLHAGAPVRGNTSQSRHDVCASAAQMSGTRRCGIWCGIRCGIWCGFWCPQPFLIWQVPHHLP
jgi:hypothetical protein